MSNGLLRLKGSQESARAAVLEARSLPDHGDSERATVSFLISDDPGDQQEPWRLAAALAQSKGARVARLSDAHLQADPMAIYAAASVPRAPDEVAVSVFSVLSTPQGACFELDGARAPVNALSAESMFKFLQAKSRSAQSGADSVFVIKGVAEAIGSFATPQEIAHIATAMSALLGPKRRAPLAVSVISSAAFDQLNSAEHYPLFMRESARCLQLPGASAQLDAVALGSSVSLLGKLAQRRESAPSDQPIFEAPKPPSAR